MEYKKEGSKLHMMWLTDHRTVQPHHILTSIEACTDSHRHACHTLGGLAVEEICFPAVSKGL